MCATSALIIFPLSCIRSMAAFSYVSLAVVCSTVYIALLLAFHVGSVPMPPVAQPSPAWSAKLEVLPLLVFAHNCQVPFLPIVSELKDASSSAMRWLLAATFLLVFVLYEAIALLGVAVFGAEVKPNVLDSFAATDVSALVGRACVLVVLTCSFPLYLYSLRIALAHFTTGKEVLDWHVTATAGIVGGCSAVALVCPSLELPIALTGALAGTMIMLVAPALMLLKARTGAAASAVDEELLPADDARGGSRGSWPGSVGLGLFAAAGVLVALVGAAAAISSARRESSSATGSLRG